MSVDAEPHDGAVQTSQPKFVLSLGYVVYQQIAGVIGAFALIAFLGHFVHIDWRGALGDLVGLWDQHVRPAVKLVFDVLIVWPLQRWLDLNIEIPLIVRDYFAVGLVQALSFERVAIGADLGRGGGVRAVARRHLRVRHWWFVIKNLAMWPYQIVLDVRGIWAPRVKTTAASGYNALILAPFAFLALLLAANFLL